MNVLFKVVVTHIDCDLIIVVLSSNHHDDHSV